MRTSTRYLYRKKSMEIPPTWYAYVGDADGGASEISVYHQIGRGIIQVSFFARVALRVDFRFENSVVVLVLKFHYSTHVILRDFSTPYARF